MLRPESTRRFIESKPSIEVRTGSILDRASLRPALAGVSHVIHCAGATKARRVSEFHNVNHHGVRNLVEALNESNGVQRLIHISSLAAAGPSLPSRPRREEDPPQPVSEYGKSKLAGELEVRERCRPDFVILRPPGVYGPRDAEFLRLFKAVKNHMRPEPSVRQDLSLVFVKDLALCAVNLLDFPGASRKTFFVAAAETLTASRMAREIAVQMQSWTIPLPLPTAVFWLLCLGQQFVSWCTGKASVLSLQKFAELRAPGWTCDPAHLEAETGCKCPTLFKEGVAQTLSWYRAYNWL